MIRQIEKDGHVHWIEVVDGGSDSVKLWKETVLLVNGCEHPKGSGMAITNDKEWKELYAKEHKSTISKVMTEIYGVTETIKPKTKEPKENELQSE